MYRYSNGQISLADFKQPVGMNLKESNRWVRKAQTIPWLEIEKRYAALFTNRKGNVAKPLRLALGACIIQAEYGYSDEETALQIQENPYLQYFCGYPGYDDEKLPFDPSLMVYFRKRLTPEVLGEINEMILRDAKARQSKEVEDKDDDNSDDGSGTGGNSGTMIVDATCAPSNIRYPQDVSPAQRGQRERREAPGRAPCPGRRKEAPHLPQARPERLLEVHKMPQTHRKNDPQSHWKAAELSQAGSGSD